MRTIRVIVVGVLLTGGLAVWAPGANASVPAMSKICRSLAALNPKFESIMARNLREAVWDVPAIRDLSRAFRKAAKIAPASIKPPLKTLAAITADASSSGDSYGAVDAVLQKNQSTLITAGLTLEQYFINNCRTTRVSTP